MSTKDTFRERRRRVAVRHSRERATQSTKPFRFFATKETKRERDIRATERASSYALTFLVSDFASPPGKSFSPIEIRKHAKERKNERTIRGRSISSSRMTCVYLSSPRVHHRSGSFIGISFVFITGLLLDAKEHDFVQIPS